MTWTCAITGASGYVGSTLVSHLRGAGHTVWELGRTPAAGNPAHRRFSLEGEVPPASLAGAHALVHCAYDFGPRDWPTIERVNVHGTRALFGAARAAGVQRLVFISSLSAHAGCRSLYGRAKLHCEDVAKEFDAVILRPGLVVGSPPGGMAGSLRRVLASPVVPVVGGSAMLYTVRASELAHATAQAALTSHIPAGMPIAAAHESPLTLLSLLRGFAEAEGRSPLFIALPSWPVLVGLRALETAGFGLGFRSDSLLGLLHGDPAPPFHATREAGLVFSPLGAEDTLRTGSGAPR